MQNINHFLIFSNTYNPKHTPPPPKKKNPPTTNPLKKIRVLRVLPKIPHHKIPLKKIRVLRAAPSAPKKLSQKIHHPQKIRVLRAAPSAPKIPTLKKSECSELLRVLPKKLSPQKKSPPKAPHPLPIFAPIVRYSALPSPLPSPINPHTILSLPHAPPHTIFASKKTQISHVHKHNAFQFRLRNRNISSS